MPEPVVISARGLGKRYQIWTHSRPTSLSDRVEHLFGAIRHRRSDDTSDRPRREDIWALQDVSFDVRRGEVLGVIGPNGAGKSTLLSILARITEPTTGRAEIRGRVSSLLEVGTGFHPELSGRDNVFLNGAILGMSRREVEDKYEEIVEFSGVRDFIDMPVKRYSSGMYVRLGFAIAASLDPEVLLLDEVLAVGDSAFQQKCMRRIHELTQSGRTVIFVSHTTASVSQLCDRAIVINGGQIVFEGDVDGAIFAYLGSPQIDGSASALEQEARHREGTGEIRVAAVRVRGADGGSIVPDRPITFEVDLAGRRAIGTCNLALDIGIWNPTGGQLVTLSTRYESNDPVSGLALGEGVTLVCEIDELPLRPSLYTIAVSLEREGQLLDSCRHQAEFTVDSSDFYNTGVIPQENHPSPVLIRQRWRVGETSRPRQAAAT